MLWGSVRRACFSFLGELVAESPTPALALQVAPSRLALRPFTFSNGVTVPAGAMVALPLCAIHMDEETYSNPERFDGFRFSKTRDDESEVAKGARSLATSTAADYLAFGIGRHAWWVVRHLGASERVRPSVGLLTPDSMTSDYHIVRQSWTFLRSL